MLSVYYFKTKSDAIERSIVLPKLNTTSSDRYIRFKGKVRYDLNFDTVDMCFDGIKHNWENTGCLK
jgi:hypothetical protein